MAKTGKGQPAPKASELPGSFKGNAEGSGASPMAESKLPGAFVSMTAGADPNAKAEHDNERGRDHPLERALRHGHGSE